MRLKGSGPEDKGFELDSTDSEEVTQDLKQRCNKVRSEFAA